MSSSSCCNQCNQWKSPITETFAEPQDSSDTSFNAPAVSSQRKSLCPNCLIGQVLPAYRPAISRWNFGRVISFNQNKLEFEIIFEGKLNKPELLQLDPHPFDAYTEHYRNLVSSSNAAASSRQQQQQQKQQQQHHQQHQRMPGSYSPLVSSASRVRLTNVSSSPPISPTPADPWYHPPLVLPPPAYDDWHYYNHYSRGGDDDYHDEFLYSSSSSANHHGPIPSTVHAATVPHNHHHHHYKPMPPPSPIKRRNHGSSFFSNNSKMNNYPGGNSSRPETSVGNDKPIVDSSRATTSSQKMNTSPRQRTADDLAPPAKQSDWKPIEDALLCRMYGVVGSKWAGISRLLPRHTDDDVKNRFLYLRQELDKQATNLSSGSSIVSMPLKAQIMAAVKRAKPHDDFLPSIANVLAHTIGTEKRLSSPNEEGCRSFGPFRIPKDEEVLPCKRCGFIVPSSQTGDGVCERTGWCVSCSQTTVFLRDDLLRLEHGLRATASSSKRVSLGQD